MYSTGSRIIHPVRLLGSPWVAEAVVNSSFEETRTRSSGRRIFFARLLYCTVVPPHCIGCTIHTTHPSHQHTCTLCHAVIDSRGGIWTNSVVRRLARLTINQDNETNASISNSRYRSTYFNPNISNNRHSSTKTIKKPA
jgi:hypothetical protein